MTKEEKGVFISSFSVALFSILPLLNLIIMRITGAGEGILGALYIFSVSLIVLLAVKYNRNIIVPWKSFWLILFTLLISFILSQGVSLPSVMRPIFFAVCTIVAFIIAQLVTIDSKTTIMFMASLPAIGILFISSFFAEDGSIKMNVTYAFLVPIIAALVYANTYYKEDKGRKKLFMLIVLIINFVYFVICLLFGSRAPSLSVVLCFLFFLCIRSYKEGKGFRFKKNSWIYLVLPLLLVLNFSSFLHITANVFNHFGWEADTIDRLLYLDDMGALDSGRSDINKLAWKGIVDSPLWGHGMSTSQKFTGFDYPHNFLSQLLLDGGIILFSIVMVPFISRLINLKKDCTYDELTFLCTLFFASVPAALFSMDIWENATFWLFMGFLLSKRYHLSMR